MPGKSGTSNSTGTSTAGTSMSAASYTSSAMERIASTAL